MGVARDYDDAVMHATAMPEIILWCESEQVFVTALYVGSEVRGTDRFSYADEWPGEWRQRSTRFWFSGEIYTCGTFSVERVDLC